MPVFVFIAIFISQIQVITPTCEVKNSCKAAPVVSRSRAKGLKTQ